MNNGKHLEALRNWKNLIDSYTIENDTNGTEIWNYLIRNSFQRFRKRN